jgi:hypothetical protein
MVGLELSLNRLVRRLRRSLTLSLASQGGSFAKINCY